jgi:hypothetical protein
VSELLPEPPDRTATATAFAAPRALVVAAAAVVVVAVLEAVHILGRDELTMGLRIGLVAVVALQLAFVGLALRGNAAGVVLLFAAQGAALLAALAPGRHWLALPALLVIALLVASASAFPTPPLPRHE